MKSARGRLASRFHEDNCLWSIDRALQRADSWRNFLPGRFSGDAHLNLHASAGTSLTERSLGKSIQELSDTLVDVVVRLAQFDPLGIIGIHV